MRGVLPPNWLLGLVASAACRWCLAVLAAALMIPEAMVSLGGPGGGDLFRPYPFDLRVGFLRSVQMVEFAGHSLNTLQLQHLLLNHVLVTGVLFALALRPSSLQAFFGPHTGQTACRLPNKRFEPTPHRGTSEGGARMRCTR